MDKLDQLIETVRKIARERPDVTSDTKTCMYESGVCSDGSVGCLFGQAFEAMGWKPYDPVASQTIDKVLNGEVGYGGKVYWCADVQEVQDCGVPWGEAVRQVDDNHDHSI